MRLRKWTFMSIHHSSLPGPQNKTGDLKLGNSGGSIWPSSTYELSWKKNAKQCFNVISFDDFFCSIVWSTSWPQHLLNNRLLCAFSFLLFWPCLSFSRSDAVRRRRCSICNKEFTNTNSLQDHWELLSHWSEDEEDYDDEFSDLEEYFYSGDEDWNAEDWSEIHEHPIQLVGVYLTFCLSYNFACPLLLGPSRCIYFALIVPSREKRSCAFSSLIGPRNKLINTKQTKWKDNTYADLLNCRLSIDFLHFRLLAFPLRLLGRKQKSR